MPLLWYEQSITEWQPAPVMKQARACAPAPMATDSERIAPAMIFFNKI